MSGTSGAAGAMPSGWSGDVANVFFSDPSHATLRSPDEIRSHWQNLSSQQQAQVRQDCSNMMASNASGGRNRMAQGSTGQSSGGSRTGSSPVRVRAVMTKT
jgi:hypothetical protein